MTSFFNIAKISALLSETAAGDPHACSMLRPDNGRKSIGECVRETCTNVDLRTAEAAARAVAEGMADYLRSYTAPASYKQILWDSCCSWHQRIAEKLGIEAGSMFEKEMHRPVMRDLGVELIKALHDEKGKTKEQLEDELGVGKKTIQTELRALDPKLQEGGKKVRPLRIAGQEMHPTIQVRSVPKEDQPRMREKAYYMEDRLHPIALQLNTQEAATLLLSLYRMNEDTGSLLSREMALDIWCQLSKPGQDRIYEVYGQSDPAFRVFLDEIREDLEDNRLVTFHTEEQQREDNMSLNELVMQSFKGGRVCRIEIRQGGKRIRLDRARIMLEEGGGWRAVPADDPDPTDAVPFRVEDVLDIR